MDKIVCYEVTSCTSQTLVVYMICLRTQYSPSRCVPIATQEQGEEKAG